VDVIDLIQCHDIEFGSIDQIVEETLPALRRVRERGKVRFLGITGLPLGIFPEVLDRTEADTVLSYCHYALNDASLDGLVPYLKGKEVGIVNASPLSMGLLTEQGAPSWHPASREIREACARAAAHCRARGQDISKLALQFSVSHPDLATTLVGTASPAHLERNARWIERPPDPVLLEEVRAILLPIRDRTWPSGREEDR
jgi:L-galactose dehydrogenase